MESLCLSYRWDDKVKEKEGIQLESTTQSKLRDDAAISSEQNVALV